MSLSLAEFLDEDDDLFQSFNVKKLDATDAATQEIAELEAQVNELGNFLRTLTQHCADRKTRYAQYLSDLTAQIAKAKAISSTQYERLLATQSDELTSLVAQQRDEINELLASRAGFDASCEEWLRLTSEIESVRVAIEESQLQTQITRVQQEQHELSALRANRVNESQADQSAKAHVLETRLETVLEEVNQLSALQRQQKQQYDIIAQECLSAQETIQRIHSGLLQTLQEEAKKRDATFNSHLDVVRKQLEQEQQRFESEAKIGGAMIEDLHQLRRATRRGYSDQIQAAVTDIRDIEELLKREPWPVSEVEAALSSVAKTQSIERENAALAQRVKRLEAELAEIQAQTVLAKTTLKRATTPAKAESPPRPFVRNPFRYS
jgi:HSP90 family molecular chaperone